jgi:protein LSM14
LISKKNIRYEGVLYSINEANATVALQNVKSFGTEGREKLDPENTAFVAPQEGIHAYLLFRGCDIKDLHVHEQKAETSQPDASATAAPPAPATTTPAPPSATDKPEPTAAEAAAEKKATASTPSSKSEDGTPRDGGSDGTGSNTATMNKKSDDNRNTNNPRKEGGVVGGRGGRGRGGGRSRMVGSGASLLNRKARGTVEGGKWF